jgi:hypothetical protein
MSSLQVRVQRSQQRPFGRPQLAGCHRAEAAGEGGDRPGDDARPRHCCGQSDADDARSIYTHVEDAIKQLREGGRAVKRKLGGGPISSLLP